MLFQNACSTFTYTSNETAKTKISMEKDIVLCLSNALSIPPQDQRIIRPLAYH